MQKQSTMDDGEDKTALGMTIRNQNFLGVQVKEL
jgi:hypothetical protein